MVKYAMVFFILIFVSDACNNSNDRETSRNKDSSPLQPVIQAKDTVKKLQGKTASNDEDPEPDPKTVLVEEIADYDKIQIVDSTILLGKDTFRIKLTHKCLHDSAIKVPVKYLKSYGLT